MAGVVGQGVAVLLLEGVHEVGEVLVAEELGARPRDAL